MAAPLPSLPLSVPAAAVPDHAVRVKPFLAALLCLLALGGAHAVAQSTTVISGTVYDPRTTSDALPLPNVLVYATTGTPSALPSGVQCLTSTNSMPADPDIVSSTYTAVDGTYTLANVPVNTTVTLVIQAGKWRMQYPNTAVGSSPLTGLALHMPANHTQGDIPMIAISTGSVDALECVFRQMGIDDCEFTDDNGAVISGCNPGGHIHLYQGSDSPGAAMSASTPSQTELMSSATLMNGYDMLMFPCQGSSSNQSTLTGATNLFDFANSGGRVFATHYSYAWLDPDSPFDAQFPSVANWTIGSEQQITSGTGTLDTSFSDGAMMAQWLQNAGATITGSPDEIEIGTLRNDVSSVIAPSQSWVTLNSGTYAGQTGNPVMQMTFNTPVGSPAASQCGRVVYNDYHVFNASATGTVYPNECPAAAAMTPQEEMLEFALFDLSSFVTPVVVPTLSISFSPSPLVVNQGDTADQVTVDVTNTSATTEVYSSTVLTLALPPGLTAAALADATGGWTCTVSTLTCARSTTLAASASDSVTLTVSVPAYGTGSAATGLITATASSPTFSSNVAATDNVIFQQPPTITWQTPASIVFGTALSGVQLDATSPVAGSFSYSPAAGTVLGTGQHTLTVTFTPTDTVDYTSATANVTLTVIPITVTLGLTSNANPVFMANAVTFTVSIATQVTAPTGTVTFYDNGTQIGTGSVSNGVATFTTTALNTQVHSITAIYSGDSSYGPSVSGVLSQNVMDFTFAVAGGDSANVPAGGMAPFSLVVSPVGGSTLPAAITLNITGLSLGAIATFAPASVAAGSGETTVTLQVQLPGSAANHRPARPFGGGPLPLALCLILLPFAGRLCKAARHWKTLAVLGLVGAGLALGVNGCGGNAALKASSYSLNVTAVSGGLSHAATLNLTVK